MSQVVCIPGDGIGPGITEAVRRILDAAGAGIDWIDAEAGLGAYELTGTPIPERTIDLIRTTKVSMKGPMTTTVGS